MFITEQQLLDLQKSHLYRNLPLSYIFYRELNRKGKFNKNNFIDVVDVRNFFSRWDELHVEIMFPDHSYLLIRFDTLICYVIHPQRGLYKEISFA